MTFTSILDREESPYKNQMRSAYYLDLNLDQLIERFQFLWKQDIRKYYYYFPANKECETYRREVFRDIKKEAVNQALENYVNQMRAGAEAKGNKEEVILDKQKDVWHLWEVYHYCEAFSNLYEALKNENLESEGMSAFRTYLAGVFEDENFHRMKTQATMLIEQLKNFHVVLTMENDIISISQEEVECSYEKFLTDCFPDNQKKLRSPFSGSLQFSNVEFELINGFAKKNPDFFDKARTFYGTYFNYADPVLKRFDEEIGFYLAYYRFEMYMKSEGFDFAVPNVEEDKPLQAVGLYDLTLAYVNNKYKKEVVSNDIVYHDGEEFFVVTGPNQGGKTTFARSLGQLIYFTKMGLDVPAVSANVHYFTDILTHFSVEESVETGRGKLKEELERLAPMMQAYFDKAFVIINELFTTAANYDATVMGKKVLQYFLDKGCKGVYVTHIKELSEENDKIVSLRALVEEVEVVAEDGDTEDGPTVRNIRKYKMIRARAEDKGYASDLVEKYKLTYRQLKKRFRLDEEQQKEGV